MIQPKLTILGLDFDDYDSLTFEIPGQDCRGTSDLFECYDRRPLTNSWKPLPVVIKRSRHRPDVYEIDVQVYAVNKKAMHFLKKFIGPFVEFLPIKVIGEMSKDSDRDEFKKISRHPDLFIVNPLIEIELGHGAVSHKLSGGCHVTKYVLHPDDLTDVPIFRVKEDIDIIVSDTFKKFVRSSGLKGWRFDEELSWSPSTKRASKSGDSHKTRKQVPPPDLPSEVELSSSKMTAGLWKKLNSQWSWACQASKARGGESKKVKIRKPLTKVQLDKLRKKVGSLPEEFENVLLRFSSGVDIDWSISESQQIDKFPSELQNCCCCEQVLWDVNRLPQYAKIALQQQKCGMPVFEKAFDRRLPFLDTGNGDYLAFDMQHGTKECPIVYLSHDGKPVRVVGKNFIEFIARWSAIGCCGPDFRYFEAFYDARKKRINTHGKLAGKWRKLMAEGV